MMLLSFKEFSSCSVLRFVPLCAKALSFSLTQRLEEPEGAQRVSLREPLCALRPGAKALSFFLSPEGPKGSKQHEGTSLCETLCALSLCAKRLVSFFTLSLEELEGARRGRI